MSYLQRLQQSAQGEPAASNKEHASLQSMPPPPARPTGLKPPAAGTIPDAAPFDSSHDASTSSAVSSPASSTQHYHLTSWDDYFDSTQDLQLPARQATFRVYQAGTQGPVVLCLHGGGYSGLTWALLANQLKGRLRVTAFDLRGHGSTETGQDEDLSAETLVQDVVAVWRELYSQDEPPVILVGHSMGGAIAVRSAATKMIANLQGLVVIDVVEGTALASLPHMATVLRQRPSSFPSLEAAVHWARKSGMSKNTEAACISIPSCLVQEPLTPGTGDGSVWAWRTPLHLSQPYWENWYKALSDLYMTVTVPKVLVLAGTDRLDRPLTVGQMQGKFQLVLLPQAGHAVHEDQHERTADVIATFVQRFRIGQPKMAIPKASDAGPPVLPVPAGPILDP